MPQDINQQVLQLNHARRALNRAENMVDIANKYDSDIQGAIKVLAENIPPSLMKPIFKQIHVKNIAGKWITIDRFGHWKFINLNRAARILRQVAQFLNKRSKVLSSQL